MHLFIFELHSAQLNRTPLAVCTTMIESGMLMLNQYLYFLAGNAPELIVAFNL
jgi:hypothetical protein